MGNIGRWIWIALAIVALAAAAFAKSVLLILLGVILAVFGAFMSRRH